MNNETTPTQTAATTPRERSPEHVAASKYAAAAKTVRELVAALDATRKKLAEQEAKLKAAEAEKAQARAALDAIK